MNFDYQNYVPCLRWKQGEYMAVRHLSDVAKSRITPLIEVPEVGYDHEKRAPSKSLDDHLTTFIKRIKRNWGERSCFVDLNLIDQKKRMENGQHPAEFVYNKLRLNKCMVTPVIGIGRDEEYKQVVAQAAKEDARGLCLRIGIEEANKSEIRDAIDGLLQKATLSSVECHLVLDLGAPNFEPVEGFAKLIANTIRKIPYLSDWRTFTLLGTSFPSSMGGFQIGTNLVKRNEWLLYKKLINDIVGSGLRLPTFGDYAINHPDVLQLDMRLVKPSATIRYTTNDSWLIVKGKNTRDHGLKQYKEHCITLQQTPQFLGSEFCYGDKYIADCAAGKASTGNLPVWRKVGTNHHIEKVVKDIANFFDSLGTP